MKALKLVAITLLLLNFFVHSYSQGNFTFNVGVLVPVSDYASDDLDDEDSGGAGMGFGIGLQYLYPLTQNGLNLFGGVDLFYNGVKKSVQDDFKDLFNQQLGISNADYKFYKMINVPLSAGLNYTFKSNEKLAVFGNAGLTFNFLKITDFEIEVSNEKLTIETDLTNNFGVKIGGGLLFNNKTYLTINYLGLGKHDLNATMTGGGMTEKMDSYQKVDMVTITLGIKF